MYWLCYCVASCNQYFMLINHPTDGATRGLTLRVCLLGQKKKKSFFFKIFGQKICSLIRSNTVYIMRHHCIASRLPIYIPPTTIITLQEHVTCCAVHRRRTREAGSRTGRLARCCQRTRTAPAACCWRARSDCCYWSPLCHLTLAHQGHILKDSCSV